MKQKMVENHPNQKRKFLFFETIRDNATHADSHQYSTGIEYIIVNGNVSIENGEYNGSLAGKLLLLTENK